MIRTVKETTMQDKNQERIQDFHAQSMLEYSPFCDRIYKYYLFDIWNSRITFVLILESLKLIILVNLILPIQTP